MEFVIKNLKESTNGLMRKIGYKPAYFQGENEASIVRQIERNDYPMFHLYIKENNEEFIFKLHLDQKKPSYKGSHAHSGESDGLVVEGEASRIKDILK